VIACGVLKPTLICFLVEPEMGIKTPKYFKTISMFGKDNQEHHGILVERIHSSVLVKPGRLSILC
jgi:hypothetical protein